VPSALTRSDFLDDLSLANRLLHANTSCMPPRPLRFGILGAAHIVPNALVAPAAKVPGVELTAIAARDHVRARDFARKHRILRVHKTYDDLLHDPDVNVIYNPLPNSLHCEWSIAALRAGKHVLCEKPMASNSSEAARMAQVADETGLLLVEAFHYRYHPLSDRIHQLIHSGAIGRLLHLEGQFMVPIPPPNIRYDWSLAGGATMDLGCYPLHMIRYFSGLTPQVVRATAEIGPPNIDVAMEADLLLGTDTTARMKCSMKANTTLMVSFTARGDRGELSATNPVGPHHGHQLVIKTDSIDSTETVPGDTSYTHQMRVFAAAVRGEAPFPTDAHEAVINMRLIDDVYRAAGLPPRAT
jgi:predicted dehydrogenase